MDSGQPAADSRLKAAAQREWRQLKHRPWDLAMISWVPLLAVALMGWIFAAGLPNQLPIGVLDQDHSRLSRQLTRFLQAAPGLQVVHQASDPAQAAAALKRGEVYAMVEIPPDFAQSIKQGQAAQVTLLHNAQFGTHSGLIQRDVRLAVGTLSAGIEISVRTQRGESAQAARVSMEPIQASMITLFNPSLNYEQFLASALIPALLHILAMTAGAWAVGRELRDRTLPQWFAANASDLQVLAALCGKLIFPVVSLTGIGLLFLLWMTLGRGWQPAGSLSWVLLALFIFIALSVALGALAAAVTRSLSMSLSFTGFVTAPAFAFSGVAFPLLSMPVLARWWANALPYTHYIRVQIEQLQMGAPVRYSVSTLAGLTLALVAAVLLCSLGLRQAAQDPGSWGKR